MVAEMLKLVIIDVVFVGLILVALLPLSNYKKAAFAVLKRNFIGYFSNPTGYVFLCLFVLLTSIAAFWPHEFFTANLANLDQLNHYLPIVMLVFIPAITMSIWAEERRQGTDELLLTLPAGDFDIVVGKYLAAAAIFTASLLFSQLANYAVLVSLTLGDLDTGLIITTYFGYWLTGLAMIAVGMVASFLTRNLTVGFILGAAFNAPLVFTAYADAIVPWGPLAQRIADWSVAAQFDDLGRGVISLSSVVYFAMVIVVGLYLSMVLIGARHWSGGRDGESMIGHYLVRVIALIVVALGANVFFSNYDSIRIDATKGRVATLSPDTIELIREIPDDRPVRVDAFLSGQVPEQYVKMKYDLVSLLKEFRARSGGNVIVNIYDGLEPFSEEVAQAEERYGIRPQSVTTRTRGALKDEQIILGAAFTSGLEKVVVPFFDRGVPVEYELVRSINTVAQAERKSLGVVTTDARVFGGFMFTGGQPQNIPKQPIIEELEKQYDVEQVDANNEIDASKYDVLLAVQPSSLGPPELENVIAAIESGVPTAIFEDPAPMMIPAPGTSDPKQSPMGMFGGGAPPPKGDIQRLWTVLGINPDGRRGGFQGTFQPDIVSQPYNPYPKIQLSHIGPEFVFVGADDPNAEEPFNPDDEITSGLNEVLFPFAGSFKKAVDSSLEFKELVSTGIMSDHIPLQDIRDQMQGNPRFNVVRPNGPYILAARIKGAAAEIVNMSDAGYQVAQADGADPAADNADSVDAEAEEPGGSGAAEAQSSAAEPQQRPIHVVYVADADCLSGEFIHIRNRPNEEIGWRFQNVTFVLNVIDSLAGDASYIDIRKRETSHSTLKMVEEQVKISREKEAREREQFENEYQKEIEKAQEERSKSTEKLQQIVDNLRNPEEGAAVSPSELQDALRSLNMREQIAQRRFDIAEEKLKRERDRKIEKIRRDMDLQILNVQNEYKFWAVALPPIPPLLVGLVVFVRRRLREREGVSRARMR